MTQWKNHIESIMPLIDYLVRLPDEARTLFLRKENDYYMRLESTWNKQQYLKMDISIVKQTERLLDASLVRQLALK